MRTRHRHTASTTAESHGRERRLVLAPEWVHSFQGKPGNIIKRYRRAFAVDWETAIAELEALGVAHDDSHLAELRRTVSTHPRERSQEIPISRAEFDAHRGIEPLSDDRFAFIAGYTSAGLPYGITWEEMENHGDGESMESQGNCEQANRADGA